MNQNLTKHAQKRMQQRYIPQMVLDWLVDFWHSEPAGNGARKYSFDKQSRRYFKKYAGQLYGSLEQHLNAYVSSHRTARLSQWLFVVNLFVEISSL